MMETLRLDSLTAFPFVVRTRAKVGRQPQRRENPSPDVDIEIRSRRFLTPEEGVNGKMSNRAQPLHLFFFTHNPIGAKLEGVTVEIYPMEMEHPFKR